MQEEAPASFATDRSNEAPQLEEQWGEDLKWPQRWRPDSEDAAVRDRADQLNLDNEVQIAAERAALENAVGPPAESAPPGRAPAVIKPAPNRRVPAPKARPALQGPAAPFADAPAVPDQSRWGNDIEWPEEWRK